MAGSYNHATTDAGNLRNNESFVQMIENLGDAYEMAEEMYGMIWFLAAGRRDDAHPESDMRDFVEEARQNYERGLEIAREANRSA